MWKLRLVCLEVCTHCPHDVQLPYFIVFMFLLFVVLTFINMQENKHVIEWHNITEWSNLIMETCICLYNFLKLIIQQFESVYNYVLLIMSITVLDQTICFYPVHVISYFINDNYYTIIYWVYWWNLPPVISLMIVLIIGNNRQDLFYLAF